MPETQTQVATATQASDNSVGAVETPTEDVAGKATGELEKTPVTDFTTGEKSSQKTCITSSASLPSPVDDSYVTPVKA